MIERHARRFQRSFKIGNMPAIGVDLGTTQCCVAIWKQDADTDEDDRVEVIINDLGKRVTPSWVAFMGTDRLVGETAKSQARHGHNRKNTCAHSQLVRRALHSHMKASLHSPGMCLQICAHMFVSAQSSNTHWHMGRVQGALLQQVLVDMRIRGNSRFIAATTGQRAHLALQGCGLCVQPSPAETSRLVCLTITHGSMNSQHHSFQHSTSIPRAEFTLPSV